MDSLCFQYLKKQPTQEQVLFTFETSIHKSSELRAFPDSWISRARATPSAKVFTLQLTKSAAAAFRICPIIIRLNLISPFVLLT